jgi:hypothetical protein
MVVGCAGSNSVKLAQQPLIPHSTYGKLRAMGDGSFHNVNDAPRNRGAANFESRKAAAHARGLWLTDELNAPKPIAGVSHKRSTMSIPNCTGDTCGGGGGGGTGGPTESYFDDNGGDYPYDVEADFSDGTSVLYESFTDSAQNDLVTTLEPNGLYELWYLNNQTRAPSPPSSPHTCLIDMDGFVYSGGSGPCPSAIPKIFCPLAAGIVGLASRWATIAFTKNPEAGNASTVLVGGTYLAACNSQ